MCCPWQLESGTGDEIITDWLTGIWFVNHTAISWSNILFHI
jgi:hypothetical protein